MRKLPANLILNELFKFYELGFAICMVIFIVNHSHVVSKNKMLPVFKLSLLSILHFWKIFLHPAEYYVIMLLISTVLVV